MKLFKLRTILLPTWQGWTLLFLIFAGLSVAAVLNIHRFLAVTERVENANILVIEAWMPKTVSEATVREFSQGRYAFLVIIEMTENNSPDRKTHSARMTTTVNYFVSQGIPVDRIIECFTPAINDHRCTAMAGAVRDELTRRKIAPRGFNILSPAAHARKTWLVYRRALSAFAPVGIVAVPTGDYDPATWWKTTNGANWVIVNSIGWFYEWISGM